MIIKRRVLVSDERAGMYKLQAMRNADFTSAYGLAHDLLEHGKYDLPTHAQELTALGFSYVCRRNYPSRFANRPISPAEHNQYVAQEIIEYIDNYLQNRHLPTQAHKYFKLGSTSSALLKSIQDYPYYTLTADDLDNALVYVRKGIHKGIKFNELLDAEGVVEYSELYLHVVDQLKVMAPKHATAFTITIDVLHCCVHFSNIKH